MRLPSVPFPKRNENYSDKDIFLYGYFFSTFEDYELGYQRKISIEASNFKNQYLSIEEEMIKSFQYVHPTVLNLQTTSARFATIIRETSNLYEILSRSIYQKLFIVPKKAVIHINNLLALESYLDFSKGVLNSPLLYSEFYKTDILHPYKSLVHWDRNSEIRNIHIPQWWNAYNKLKHDLNGIRSATLENALLSLGAAYLLINRVFGDGVVGGILYRPIRVSSLTTNLIEQQVPVSKLFIEDTRMFSVGLT